MEGLRLLSMSVSLDVYRQSYVITTATERGKKTLAMVWYLQTEQKATRLGEACLGLFSFENTP
jgi:hypothetical protein